MLTCPCGGWVDIVDLTGERTRMMCKSCKRYEIVEPVRQKELSLSKEPCTPEVTVLRSDTFQGERT